MVVCVIGVLWLKTPMAPAKPDGATEVVPAVAPKPLKMEADSEEKETPQPVVNKDISSAALLQRIRALLPADNNANYDPAFTKLLEALIRSDPVAAAHLAESIKAGSSLHEELMQSVARNWTAQDPASAEKWAAQLPAEKERASMLSSVCFQIAQADAGQAIEVAEQHGLEKAPGAVMENLVQQWAAQDFSSAESWVKQAPAGEQRDNMFARLALVQSQTAPADAAQIVVQQIPPGPVQDEAAMSVLTQWATRDLAGATAWVKSFPSGALRERAEKELANIPPSQQSK